MSPFVKVSISVDLNGSYLLINLVSTDGQLIFPIGTQQSAVWNAGTSTSTNPTISYSYQDKRVQIELICAGDDTNLFEPLGEIATNDFRFRLTHKDACWKKYKGNSISPIQYSLLGYRYGKKWSYIITFVAISGFFSLMYFALRFCRTLLRIPS